MNTFRLHGNKYTTIEPCQLFSFTLSRCALVAINRPCLLQPNVEPRAVSLTGPKLSWLTPPASGFPPSVRLKEIAAFQSQTTSPLSAPLLKRLALSLSPRMGAVPVFG